MNFRHGQLLQINAKHECDLLFDEGMIVVWRKNLESIDADFVCQGSLCIYLGSYSHPLSGEHWHKVYYDGQIIIVNESYLHIPDDMTCQKPIPKDSL